MTSKKNNKPVNPVDRLIASMEKRLETYRKNKARITADMREQLAIQDRKIADVQLQIKALKKS